MKNTTAIVVFLVAISAVTLFMYHNGNFPFASVDRCSSIKQPVCAYVLDVNSNVMYALPFDNVCQACYGTVGRRTVGVFGNFTDNHDNTCTPHEDITKCEDICSRQCGRGFYCKIIPIAGYKTQQCVPK